MEVRRKKSIGAKKAPMIAGTAAFLVILFALFGLSVPHAIELLKDVREWGVAEAATLHKTFETDYNAAFPHRTDFINLNGLMARMLQKRELNEVYKLKNGYLGNALPMQEPSAFAERIAAFQTYLSERGSALVYVQVPSKESMRDAQMPDGIVDASRESAERMLTLLRERQVKTLDLTMEMEADGFTLESAFFCTDHHWRPETAFWASGRIMSYLHDTFGTSYDASVCDLENYHVDVYKNWLLGSRGKRTGTLYAGVDDFSVIYPKFETEMTTSFPAGALERHGSFYDANIDEQHLIGRDYFGKIAYCTYIGGDYPVVVHENASAVADTRVLLIKDSFALPLQAFLSLHLQRLDVIDLRYYQDSLTDYIERAKPDVVLICYNPWATGEEFYGFGKPSASHVAK